MQTGGAKLGSARSAAIGAAERRANMPDYDHIFSLQTMNLV